ncbi:MAG: serine/threonine transporter SstT, partial [Psychrobacter sp.]|nr:serine/threonine transporter SstT [Psychrobacter sp.]
MHSLIAMYQRIGLVPLIVIGLVLGTLIGWLAPSIGIALGILGTLFVGALKAVAPILVFFLVMAAICQHRSGNKVYVKPVLFLYLIGTFVAALVAVGASFLFPTELTLVNATIEQVPPANLKEVLNNLLLSLIANPVDALANANYIGILAWAVIIGVALRQAGETTRSAVNDVADAISKVVKWVIALAPFGILGLVANTVADTGFVALLGYARILLVLIGCMLFIALVTNPILVYLKTGKNPYP